MKIIITIGPNRVTNFAGRVKDALGEARRGLVKGWRKNKPAKVVKKDRNDTTTVKAA